MASLAHPGHGLAMLQAASIALADGKPSTKPSVPPQEAPLPLAVPPVQPQQPAQRSTHPSPPQPEKPTSQTPPQPSKSLPGSSQPSGASLSALLNPAPSDMAAVLPPGFVLGKDGKIKKKRGRKPTPGLTDEDRRQARLLKNRRTAETSRRRKLALLKQLTSERDEAKRIADQLRKHNDYLTARLAMALGKTVADLLRDEPAIALRSMPGGVPEPVQSDVSRPGSVADSDSDSNVKKS